MKSKNYNNHPVVEKAKKIIITALNKNHKNVVVNLNVVKTLMCSTPIRAEISVWASHNNCSGGVDAEGYSNTVTGAIKTALKSINQFYDEELSL